MINIVIQIDPANNRSGFDAEHNGRKIPKLELAHLLSQFVAGLIYEGAQDSGSRIIKVSPDAVSGIRKFD